MSIPPCRPGAEHSFRHVDLWGCDFTLCGDHAGISCDLCYYTADYVHQQHEYQEILALFTVADKEEEA